MEDQGKKIKPPTAFSQKKRWGVKVCQVASVDLTVRFLLLRQLQFLKKQGFKVSTVCSRGERVKDLKKKKALMLNQLK